jgi:hypothetical protein
MTLREAAYFLLTKPPLEELTDNIADIVERFRYKSISKNQAAEMLIDECNEELTQFIQRSIDLSAEVSI